jgi:hypothetical protein
MSDFVDIEDQPVPDPNTDDFDIAIVEPGQEEESSEPSWEEKLAALAEKNKELETKLGQQAPMDQLAQQLASLAKPQVVEKKEEPKPNQIDWASLTKKIDSDFYSSPSKNILELVTPIFEQMQTKSAKDNAEKDKVISKLATANDPKYAPIYNDYKDEVEQLVNTLPPHTNVYQEAVEKVRSNHYSEIMEKDVQARVDELVAKALEGKGVTPNRQFTNATSPPSTPPAQPQTNGYKVTRAQFDAAQKWADTMGFPFEDSTDKRWVIDHLKKEGKI